MENCSKCSLKLFYTDRGLCPKCGTQNPHQHPPKTPKEKAEHIVEKIKEVTKVIETDVKASDLTLDTAERNHIVSVVNLYENNRTHAARALGITIKTLYNKLEQYGLHVPREEQHAK